MAFLPARIYGWDDLRPRRILSGHRRCGRFHLLVGLKATHCLADIMRELKKAASAWVHEKIGLQTFSWQEGYAAFTISAPARLAVQQYIVNQEEHHRVRSSRDELLEMLAKAEIEYDSQYFE